MSPEQLTELLCRLRSAADIVEAIEDPELQRRRGWDLAGWRYEPVPWGVRFLGGGAEVVALVTVPRQPEPPDIGPSPRPRGVVLVG
jgi:hypothetical protein